MTTDQEKSIHLGLLLHNHQPVGNFPWVFQQVYEESYLPFLEALERHPSVRLSLHYTGSLLDWLKEAQPAFLQRVAALVQKNQVEMVGGGYYEPILTSIPDQDKVGQIRKLSEHVQKYFATTVSGMWLAERVWEPALPGILRAAGIEWTILDDVHLKSVGLEDNDLFGYYATEDQSPILKIFATSQALRYTVPWRPVGETIDLLRSLATSDGQRIVVMGDDGEKFGSWPDTQEYCWGHDGRQGWIEEFFTRLEEHSSWLHTTPPGEYARQYHALGRIYIPTSSYIEMTEWALPARKSHAFGRLLHKLQEEHEHEILQFMRGGFWRNFLVRYPEVNNQHKKMLRVHDAVYAAGASVEHGLNQLWKAQSNDTYWHGLFGGIYMGHVRSAIYHHLLKAENLAQRATHGEEHWQNYDFIDFDCDSRDELLIEGDLQNLYLDPQRGGTLFEWDLRRSMHNLLCVMTRREEGYHQILREYERERRKREGITTREEREQGGLESPHTTVRTKEPDLDRLLVVDRYQRSSLIDHFLSPSTNLENFAQARYEEPGDFIEQPYEAEVQQDGLGVTATLERVGSVQRQGALLPQAVRISKTLFVPNGREELIVRYTIHNKSETRLQTRFACEWNIHLLGGGGNDQAYYRIPKHHLANSHFDSNGEISDVENFQIGNTWIGQKMDFTLSAPASLWRYSIETVTGSEAGFERNHQGSCMLLIWPLLLEPEQSWQVEISCAGSAE